MYNRKNIEEKYIKILLDNLDDNNLWSLRVENFLINLIDIDFSHSSIGLIDLIEYNIIKKSTTLKEYLYNIPGINESHISGIEKPSYISISQHGYLMSMIVGTDKFIKNIKLLDNNNYIYNDLINLKIEIIRNDKRITHYPDMMINDIEFSGENIKKDFLYYIKNYNELKDISSKDISVLFDINRI